MSGKRVVVRGHGNAAILVSFNRIQVCQNGKRSQSWYVWRR